MIETRFVNAYLQPLIEANEMHLAILLRLMWWITENQQWLPLDREACQRIARASRRDMQRELDRVLAQHFTTTDDGRIPDARALVFGSTVVRGRNASEQQRSNACVTPALSPSVTPGGVTPAERNAARQKRHRLEKAALRTELLKQGITTRKKASISELRKLMGVTPGSNAGVTQALPERDSRTRARPGYPLNTNTEDQRQGEDAREGVTPTAYGEVARAMKAAGLQAVNPSHPLFRSLVDNGGCQELVDAAAECVANGKGFAYALAVVRGRRQDAAAKGDVAARRDRLREIMGEAAWAAMHGEQP